MMVGGFSCSGGIGFAAGYLRIAQASSRSVTPKLIKTECTESVGAPAQTEQAPVCGPILNGEARWRRGGDSNPRSHKGSRDFESRRLNLTPEPLRTWQH